MTEDKKKFPEIQTVVAKDTGDGYIRLSLVIETKFHQFRVKRSIAVNIIKALAESLDDKLHTV
jgi:hypothetical protein